MTSGRSPSPSLLGSIHFHQDTKLTYLRPFQRTHFESGPTGQGDSLCRLFMRVFLEANCKQFMAPGYLRNQIAVLGVTGKTGRKDETF